MFTHWLSGLLRGGARRGGRPPPRPWQGGLRVLAPERLEDRVVPGFLPPVSYGVGQYVLAVVAADLNGGGTDLVTANNDSNTVSVLLNNGNGTFAAASHYAAGPAPFGVAASHFRDPNVLDLAVANNTGPNGTVSVLLNNGDGTFQPPVAYSVGSSVAAVRVATGDFNADGRADLVSVNRTGTNQTSVSVLLGNGNGTFQSPVTYPLGAIN